MFFQKYVKHNIYVLDTDACGTSPCENGATCIDAVDQNTCLCFTHYMGTHCETGKYLTNVWIIPSDVCMSITY